MKNDNKIVAIYIRVSTDSQTEFSPDAQLKAIKQYAKTHNYEIDTKYIYKDEGISGRRAEKRPAFMEMIKTAKTKPHSPFSKILVHKFDRFARNREDSVVYKSLLKKECNVDVISITEDFGDDKFSILIEALLEAMAEYYSLNLSDEVLKGMTEKANRGEPQTKAPYGYNIKDKNYYINENEAKVVKQIFTDFSNGESMSSITLKLNKMDIKTKQGNKWEIRTIEYLLRNPVYISMVTWTPGRKKSFDYKKRDEEGIKKEGNFEPIISTEIFEKVQNRIKANKERFKYIKPKQEVNWIRRLVKCSKCGSSLTPTKGALQCIGYSHKSCNSSHYIKIDVIKTAILEQIKKDYEDPIELNIIKHEKEQDNIEEVLLHNLNKVKEKLKRCKSLYLEGIDTIEEYKENKTVFQKQKENIEKELTTFRLNHQEGKKDASDFKIKAKNVYELLINENTPEEMKYTIIHELIDKVIFYKETHTIEIFYKL